MMVQVSEYPHNFLDALEHQPRLLIVDDMADNAQALRRYLERMGFDVHLAFDGESALNKINEIAPDLLILDLNLPDMPGFDLTMRVREFQDYYLPIIIVTAADEERKRLASMVSGADDYLPKPVVLRDLLVRVQALLRTKIHLDRLMFEKRRLLVNLEEQNEELEDALKAVEQADLMKKNLLNVVPHEMRTPMLQIKSAVHLLVEDIRKVEPESTAADLAMQAVSRMEGIIQNFTELARLESIKQDIFSLKDAVSGAVRVVERSWSTKDDVKRIQIQVAEDLPPVIGDRRGVSRIMAVLLENALKFDPAKHPVTLAAVYDDLADQIEISITDRGIGIPAEKLDLIFQEFYQVDTSPTRPFGGSGIGLSIARLLSRQMGFEIHVTSKVSKGSRFSFRLPVGTLDA